MGVRVGRKGRWVGPQKYKSLPPSHLIFCRAVGVSPLGPIQSAPPGHPRLLLNGARGTQGPLDSAQRQQRRRPRVYRAGSAAHQAYRHPRHQRKNTKTWTCVWGRKLRSSRLVYTLLGACQSIRRCVSTRSTRDANKSNPFARPHNVGVHV